MAPRWGVDADSKQLTIGRADATDVVCIANTTAAIERWLATLPEGSVIAVESSGSCHDRLLACAVAQARPIYLLNAGAVRHYAWSLGRRAKTDRVDAQVIARYLDREIDTLRAYTPPSPALARLSWLLRRRAELVTHRQALRASMGEGLSLTELETGFQHLLDHIDDELDTLIQSDMAAADLRARLVTVPGVGPLVSALLVSLLQRTPFASSDALVAFVGFDPRPADSGQHRGRRRLSKHGCAEARRLLFLAAQAFSRTSLGQPLYQRYRARALSATASFVILARKLLRIAWAIWRSGGQFEPDRFAAACART